MVRSKYGAVKGRTYRHVLGGFSANVSRGQLDALRNDPGVAHVELDRLVWAVGQPVPTGVDRIDGDLNSTANIDGADDRVGVNIAIIDTGVDTDHPDLNVVGGYASYAWMFRRRIRCGVFTSSFNDQNGHGTHVAGTAAALDNNIGVVGVAPGAAIWSVRVLTSNGGGCLSDVIAGIDWVTSTRTDSDPTNDIAVANMSLGWQGNSPAARTAIQSSVAAGVVYMVAAGNEGSDVYGPDGVYGTGDEFEPASYPEVAAISAMADSDGQAGGNGSITSYGNDDSFAFFSNYSGSAVAGNPVDSPGAGIDLLTPGVDIYSTYMNAGYATLSGTSMAAPHAAGLAALYIAENGLASDGSGVYVIRQALADAGMDQGSQNRLSFPASEPDNNPENLGWAGISGPAPPVNQPPTVSIVSPATGSTFQLGASTLFSGSASDTEDGDLTASLVWSSDVDGQIGTGGSFSTVLSEGNHTITASVTDSGGQTGSASVSVNVVNDAPSVSISSPADSSTFQLGASILFSGLASDTEDGDLSASLVWSSDVDGQIGTGGSFSTALSGGNHTITASVTDSGGQTGSASVSVNVVNDAPSVSITSPANGSTFQLGASILFSGSASDTEDGDLTASLVWSSDVDGQIGTGGSFSTALSGGSHTITASVNDSGGQTGSASVSVNVVNDAPSVSITSPTNGSTFQLGASIQFGGSASDTEDGDLGGSLVWSSNVDGQIGTGGSFSTALSGGSHTITASVNDSGGQTGSASISVSVVNDAPSVSITSPTNGSTFQLGTSILFSGSASDTEDGNLTASLVWSSDVDGQIGTDGSFSTALSEGNHTITASVTDSGGQTGSASISVSVVNDAPSVSINSPTDGSTFEPGASISFSGTASDTEDGDLSTSLVWSSDVDGQIGSGGSFSTVLGDGNHTITASVTDSGGKTGSASVSISVGSPEVGLNVTIERAGNILPGRIARFFVTVVDEVGDPVQNASVTLTFDTGGRDYTQTRTTNASGLGDFRFRTRRNDALPWTLTAVATSGEATGSDEVTYTGS